MSKLNYCYNGRSVTNQVILYQQTHDSRDYLPIQIYYDDYKDHWFSQLEDYMDRQEFESDFDYKLACAVNSFKEGRAKKLQEEKGYGATGAFNGLFYQILSNWKSNIKTSSFRLKKRPAVRCPVCGRKVGRIDENHLQHYKSPRDFPSYVVFEGQIYECVAQPKVNIVCWGDKTNEKMASLKAGNTDSFHSEKRRIRWPWKMPDGTKGVLCPFTKNIVPKIDDDYIRSLPDKFSRYAPPMTWEMFNESYPYALIQSEVFDLQHLVGGDDNSCIGDYVSEDRRIGPSIEGIEFNTIMDGKTTSAYEYVFHIIDQNVEDLTDRGILKLVSAGYSVDDIAESLSIPKKDIKTRLRAVKENKEFEVLLRE